jgi:hypothetical protein
MMKFSASDFYLMFHFGLFAMTLMMIFAWKLHWRTFPNRLNAVKVYAFGRMNEQGQGVLQYLCLVPSWRIIERLT